MIVKLRWILEQDMCCEITLRDGRVYYGSIPDIEKEGVTMEMIDASYRCNDDASGIITALDFKSPDNTIEIATNINIPNWLLPDVV